MLLDQSRTAVTAQGETPSTRRFLCGFDLHRFFDFSSDNAVRSRYTVCIISPYGIGKEKVSHLEKEKQKLLARIKRIRGQVDSIERSLSTGENCADLLMLLANVRGGINSLMAEVLEDHIRLHMMDPQKVPTQEVAEDLIDLVRAYLK